MDLQLIHYTPFLHQYCHYIRIYILSSMPIELSYSVALLFNYYDQVTCGKSFQTTTFISNHATHKYMYIHSLMQKRPHNP